MIVRVLSFRVHSHFFRIGRASTSLPPPQSFVRRNVRVEQCTHGEANFSHGSSSRMYLSKQKRFKTTKYEGMQVLVFLSFGPFFSHFLKLAQFLFLRSCPVQNSFYIPGRVPGTGAVPRSSYVRGISYQYWYGTSREVFFFNFRRLLLL